MTARIAPGREGGPCYGRLRGAGRTDPGKAPGFFQPGQVGQLAGREQTLDDAGFQTIETDDDDLLDDGILAKSEVFLGSSCQAPGYSRPPLRG